MQGLKPHGRGGSGAAARRRPLSFVRPALALAGGCVALAACDGGSAGGFRSSYLRACHDQDVTLWIDSRVRDCECAADIWEQRFTEQELAFLLAVYRADIDQARVDQEARRFGFDDKGRDALLKKISIVAMDVEAQCSRTDKP